MKIKTTKLAVYLLVIFLFFTIVFLYEYRKVCKKEIFWDMAVKLIWLEEGFNFKPYYILYYFSTKSEEKEFLPNLKLNELPLYYLNKYLEYSGSKERKWFHILYGQALLLNGEREKAINEFLKASDDELDLNPDALKKFGKKRLKNMDAYAKVPRWEVIWYLEEKGDCELALAQIKRGLKNSQVAFVKLSYQKLEEEHYKKCNEGN